MIRFCKYFKRVASGGALLAVCVCTAIAQAQSTTSVVAFQGRVSLPSGEAPTNALYRMRFTLYDAPIGGSALWTESNSDIPVAGGLFVVGLGSIIPFPEGLFAGDPDLYLEVAVDTAFNGIDAGDVQSPRTPLNAVPVALEAGNAAMLGGSPASAYATQSAVDAALEGKAEKTELDIIAAVLSSDIAATSIALNEKAAQSDVAASQAAQDAVIAMKADADIVGNALAEKANQTDVESGLALKADQSEVDTTLAAKANQSDVDAALTRKADASSLFQWQVVSAGPVAMEPNRGYVVKAESEVSLDLPASDTLAIGDVVRVSAIGTAGWRIAQGDVQSVRTGNLQGSNPSAFWTPRDSNRDWSSVASSADGTRLVACVLPGQLYTSRDSGVTWTPRESSRSWKSVASSADGTKLVACVGGGQGLTSTDSGTTWTVRAGAFDLVDVASSADGTKLVAGRFGGQLYTSTDSGVTWTARESNRQWRDVASSADGTRLMACVFGGQL
jgi:hypothetical protein